MFQWLKVYHHWIFRLRFGGYISIGFHFLDRINSMSLLKRFPVLGAEYHPSRNGLDFDELSVGSGRMVWWVCSEGHEWEASVKYRVEGHGGCPTCASLAFRHPNVAAQWHPTKNLSLDPEKIRYGSGRKVWWICDKGHEWEMTINNRVGKGQGCPYCSGQKVAAGEKDIFTTHPDIASQWHPTKNNLAPTQMSAGSNRKVWWLGECGHEWEASVRSQVKDGVKCPECNSVAFKHPNVVTQWNFKKNEGLNPKTVSYGSKKIVWWICDKGHEWRRAVHLQVRLGIHCSECQALRFSSKPEKSIQAFMDSLVLLYRTHERSVVKKMELDIYIPDKKIGIEFNGLYWHDENHKTQSYHHAKWLAAKEAGVQLIQIWEDDWNRNPELIKRMLAHKLGVSQEKTVYARKTRVEVLSKADAELFMDEYHIQEHANGSYYLGLRDIENDEVVAVLVLKKEPGTDGKTLNIMRYATSVNVVGGFTKLLKHAERTYVPEKFITFADHTVSDGGLYESNGFIAEKELYPDYMYVVKGERKHKFGYRLKRFRNDPELKFEEGLTERELAELNNIPRIWDAGKTRYVKTIP